MNFTQNNLNYKIFGSLVPQNKLLLTYKCYINTTIQCANISFITIINLISFIKFKSFTIP